MSANAIGKAVSRLLCDGSDHFGSRIDVDTVQAQKKTVEALGWRLQWSDVIPLQALLQSMAFSAYNNAFNPFN